MLVTLPRLHADDVIDSPMYKLPDLPLPPVVTELPMEAKELWLRALARPEADLQIKAAEAIALARQRGFQGIETTIEPLLALFANAELHPSVRLAIARTLVTLDAKSAAATLFEHAKSGSGDLQQIVEPPLARWDYRPARDVWLTRLADAKTPPRILVLAIQGLGMVREQKAADRLRELALSERTSAAIRLEAARSLGKLRKQGLEADAEELTADPSPRGMAPRLLATAFLHEHQSPKAYALMQRLTRDPEPAVATTAVARLLEVDPDLVVPSLEHLLAHADANLRSLAVDVLMQRPSEQHLRLLADRLDDAHPDTRVKARRFLVKLAEKKDLHGQVITQATRVLAAPSWRGQEQAAIVLTQLDHKAAAGRLLQLLPSKRAEVRVTAAWGIRKLAVRELLPGVAKFVDEEWKRVLARQASGIDGVILDHQLSQLHQFLGQQKYIAADPFLRRLVPKREDMAEARASAIWALGMIHEGAPVADLGKALESRLNDSGGPPPEDPRIHLMAAISLGRMKDKAALPSLRKHFSDGALSLSAINNACGWAIEQITGEKMGPAKTIRRLERDWFLVPN
jgi:HEAT repeat protein